MSARKYEHHKVLTFFGDRGWHEDNGGYTEGSVNRGHRRLNEYINRLGTVVTIHSVSYSHVILPDNSGLVRLFATIVYSSDLDVIDYFGAIDSNGKSRKSDETVIEFDL